MAITYSEQFFDRWAAGSLRSARIVVPMALQLTGAKSVVDVGCGIGTWLKAFAEAGIHDYLGIDGDYVERSQLQIPADRFQAADLNQPLDAGRAFDLAISLEVAEHLPESAAAQFVASLVSLAPVIMFSAAVPGQGGVNHLNEQPPDYWRAHFGRHGFNRTDPIRPRIANDRRVELWYRQNIYLFAQHTE